MNAGKPDHYMILKKMAAVVGEHDFSEKSINPNTVFCALSNLEMKISRNMKKWLPYPYLGKAQSLHITEAS